MTSENGAAGGVAVRPADFRQLFSQMVATLTRLLGPSRLAIVEDAAQDALVAALQTWPFQGPPANPSAWLIAVARNRALDQIRRERWFDEHAAQIALSTADEGTVAPAIGLRTEPLAPADDQLAMMFLACHPLLAREARVALTLKTVCGFGVAEIARALLTTEDAIAQRLVRAKRALRDADVRFDLAADEYADRVDSVLDVLYLLFNEGYAAHGGDDLIRRDLADEAVRLGRLLAADHRLASPAVHALLALMLLLAARFPARMADDGVAGELRTLEAQDRSRWDWTLIDGGLAHLERAASGDRLTPYHLEAGIAACHATASGYGATDWARIVDLYDTLVVMKPTSIVVLNRAIALARLRGPGAGLAALAPALDDPALSQYYLLHATLGQLRREAGDRERAAGHFRAALACGCSAPERRFLERQLASL